MLRGLLATYIVTDLAVFGLVLPHHIVGGYNLTREVLESTAMCLLILPLFIFAIGILAADADRQTTRELELERQGVIPTPKPPTDGEMLGMMWAALVVIWPMFLWDIYCHPFLGRAILLFGPLSIVTVVILLCTISFLRSGEHWLDTPSY